MLCMLLLTSFIFMGCNNDEGLYPGKGNNNPFNSSPLYVFVENAGGEDLLDTSTSGNLLVNDVILTINKEAYILSKEITKENSCIKLAKNKETGNSFIYISMFLNLANPSTLTIDWGNKDIDTITYKGDYKENDSKIMLYINGKVSELDKDFLCIRLKK